MGFASNFKAGIDIANALIDTYQTSKRQGEISAIAKSTATDAYTPQQGQDLEAIANAKDADGKPYYTVGNDAPGKYTVAPNFQNETGAAPTDYTPATMAAKGVAYLGKNYDAPLTDAQTTGARQQAMAGVMEKYGDAEGAMRYRQQAQQGELTTMQLAQAKRTEARASQEDADTLALRKAMTNSIAANGVQAGEPAQVGAPGETLTPTSQQSQQTDLNGYLNNGVPGVVKTLLSQGKVAEAKRYTDFVDSEAGKTYAKAWTTGLRKHAMGDHVGAIKSFETLYNSQMFNDGQTVKIVPLEGGKQYQVSLFDAKGNAAGSQTLNPATLASQAALMLEPTKAVEFHAQQQGKREAEGATLDRQLQLEAQRQEGAAAKEDRRDKRQELSLDARDKRLERSLAARAALPGRGLTATQQRSNFEIDDAREQVSSMDAAEIRRRTAKQTDTGRENPDYDPTLARASNLANRRKVGEDQTFDARRSGAGQQAPAQPTPGQGVDRQEVAKRFRSDKTMNAYRLGGDTPKGTEVLDKSGRVIGHYR